MDSDLRSIQQARDLATAAREAMRSFQFTEQAAVDRICKAMVDAAMREAGRLGQMAHDETGFGYPNHKKLKNEFAAAGVWESIKDTPTCGVLRRDEAKTVSYTHLDVYKRQTQTKVGPATRGALATLTPARSIHSMRCGDANQTASLPATSVGVTAAHTRLR